MMPRTMNAVWVEIHTVRLPLPSHWQAQTFGFDVGWRGPAALVFALEDQVGLGEAFLDVAAREHHWVEHKVAAGRAIMDQGRTRLQRIFDGEHRRQSLRTGTSMRASASSAISSVMAATTATPSPQ